jgi:hypothetical protein
LSLLAVAPGAQAKFVVSGFGNSSSSGLGGEFYIPKFGFAQPRGIVVNTSGAGAPAGTSYVIDTNANRIQRFNAQGEFQRTWGQNVIGRDERQKLIVRVNDFNPGGGDPSTNYGSFSLVFEGEKTAPIEVAANSGGSLSTPGTSEVKNALVALPSIGPEDVTITGDEFEGRTIRFTGALSGTDFSQMAVDNSGLSGASATVTTVENGSGGNSSGFEICTTAPNCREGERFGATGNGGQLNEAQGLAVNQANGHVYVTESGNRRVSEFDANGNFIRAWGWDVVESGKPNDNGTGFEICDTTNGNAITDCQKGAAGANGGQFGETIGRPVTDSSNNVWIPDPANRRIQEFDSEGQFIAAYGYNVDALGGGGAIEECTSTASGACQAGTSGSGAGQFSFGNPTEIALDSSGNVYALDQGNNRVQKFDAALTTASNFGGSTFSAYTTAAPEHIASTMGGARLAFSVSNNVNGGGERQILELDPADASVEDVSLVGAELSLVGGLAAGASEKVYLTTREPSPRVVLVLDSTRPPNPSLGMDDVTVKTDTTATFSGTVDPLGGLVSCRFQYSTDLSNWTSVPVPGCASLALIGGPQAVSAQTTGLIPNTHYYARLVASRPLLAGSETVMNSAKAFDTDAPPPAISDVSAVQVNDTSARLVGTIDPKNSDTGYVFQYGPTPALGSSTAPVDIGGGTTPITVSQLVGGLSKGTTYYFRLVATNLTGTTTGSSHTFHTRTEPFPPANPGNCPNEAVRSEQSATYLPDCRAFEMVSPPDKNQGSVAGRGGAGGEGVYASFSEDGEAVGFCTASLLGEPAGQLSSTCAQYVSRRGASGWTTVDPLPRFCASDPYTGVGGVFQGSRNVILEPQSFKRYAVAMPEFTGCKFFPLAPGAPADSINVYRGDSGTDPTSFDLLTPNQSIGFSQSQAWPVGGSEDFSHVVFTSWTNETADSPPQETYYKLYDWAELGAAGCSIVSPAYQATLNGCLNLVGKDPSGSAFAADTRLPSYVFSGFESAIPSAVSGDGERIYFQSPAVGSGIGYGACAGAACDVYMREGDAVTYDVSAGECTGPCGIESAPDGFLWATRSGDKAFFASCAQLTDASSAGSSSCNPGTPVTTDELKLYRWDRDAPPGHRLVDLSVDHESADGHQPEALDVVGASTDEGAPPDSNAAPGNTVYFVAGGQIVAGEPAPTGAGGLPKGLKLYRWRWNGGSPSVDYLGRYVSSVESGQRTSETQVVEDPNADRNHVRVTPDGKYVVIQTVLALDPAADRDSDVDLYRWDEEDGWMCASCQVPGAPSLGGANSYTPSLDYNIIQGDLGIEVPKHSISEDGKRIFFSTPDPLVPQDVNAEGGCPFKENVGHPILGVSLGVYDCADVYEWHDGTVSLLTSGTGSRPFMLMGATADGKNVFVATAQRMVGWDKDTQMDIYDIRTTGGFPEPPPAPAACEGEACRGPATVASAGAGAGTAAFEGPGNPAAKHPKPHKRHHHKAHKRHHERAHRRAANHNRRAGR